MPLGQQPFGTRSPQTPDPEQPQPPGPAGGGFGRARWLYWVLASVLVGVMAWQMRSGEKKAVDDHTECLTDRTCGPGWHCYAVPKDDPFAVAGVCSHECTDDAQCAAPLKCTEVAATSEGQVVPLNAKGAGAQHLHVCRPP